MKRMLPSIVSTIMLCFANSLCATNNNIDELYNVSSSSSSNQKSGSEDHLFKISHDSTSNKTMLCRTFYEQGYFLQNLHSPEDLAELISLKDNLYSQAIICMQPGLQSGNNKLYAHRHKGPLTTSRNPAIVNGDPLTNRVDYIQYLYKSYTPVLKLSQNNAALDIVSELVGCGKDEILHTRNDMVFNSWRTYKSGIFNSSRYRKHQTDQGYNNRYLKTITVLSHDDVTLEIWEGAMSLDPLQDNYPAVLRDFRKNNPSSHSIPIDRGIIIALHPSAEFDLTHKKKSLEKITLLINEYAHPKAYVLPNDTSSMEDLRLIPRHKS